MFLALFLFISPNVIHGLVLLYLTKKVASKLRVQLFYHQLVQPIVLYYYLSY